MKPGFILPGGRRLSGASYCYLQLQRYREDIATFFSEMNGDATKDRCNRHKLEHAKFPLKIRKTFSTTRVVKYWTRLP